MTCAIAVPMTKNSTSRIHSGDVSSSSRKPMKAAATPSMATVHTARAPNRSTTSRDRGAKINCAAASGSRSSPESSGDRPRTLWM